jgi:hypothetical protein
LPIAASLVECETMRILALAAVLGLFASTARGQSLAIDGLTGPITAHEIDAFKAFMKTRTPPPNTWGVAGEHNALADGAAGRDMEAMGLMVEVTHDRDILDRLIFFADTIVAMRNDLPGGEHRVMWTGNVDMVWPPEPPGTTGATYAGGENGDTIAHIAYAALLILRDPTLWNLTVPDADPHHYGATYLARAKTYAARCAEANDEYSAKYFVQPTTNLIRDPTNWPAGFHTMEAINIQMMLDGGFQRDAEIHEILADDPARVARYDTIVKTSVRECLNGMKHPYVAGGHTVTKWFYYPWDTTHVESVGHAGYDVQGLWRASKRATYGIAIDELKPIADTLSYVISLGGGMFSGDVLGGGTPQNYMLGEWTPVGQWNDTAYALMASADVASGRYAHTPHITAAILWMKGNGTGIPDGGVPSVDAGSRVGDSGSAGADLGGGPDAGSSSLDTAGAGPEPDSGARVETPDALARTSPSDPDATDGEPGTGVSPAAPKKASGGCSCSLGAREERRARGIGCWGPLAALALGTLQLRKRWTRSRAGIGTGGDDRLRVRSEVLDEQELRLVKARAQDPQELA